MPRLMNADEVLSTMGPWLDYGHMWKKKLPKDSRTVEEAAWDSAILAASEYVRRLTNDEDLALTVHDLLSVKSKDISAR